MREYLANTPPPRPATRPGPPPPTPTHPGLGTSTLPLRRPPRAAPPAQKRPPPQGSLVATPSPHARPELTTRVCREPPGGRTGTFRAPRPAPLKEPPPLPSVSGPPGPPSGQGHRGHPWGHAPAWVPPASVRKARVMGGGRCDSPSVTISKALYTRTSG